ncbi:D-glycero-beta-D-manno-heptose 1-phosphate adenylyltransferase [Dissulfurirhabdus thermomarina]|uniref:D-glycero-beta-D-manno-heptose 1-phosphate adenylyltransferase n=1 Tax=Dissulfurirhabdus thermomarina TaxID=1765737 RepID=A0A6N9TQN7_DISTH|nr:D-glycero-beta-D-manno-heptose 1-phosphate adenylyltransferase [Dissulfurirhabdus thermomarina]NMX24470.1 D-glycero-beta-D-manno-heptose 1-phosphate adenylyltransferase [Dissulfurirhabdus thermomarina]
MPLEAVPAARSAFATALPPTGWPFHAERKVLDLEALAAEVRRRQAAGQRVVFTNGCFDLLHAGHARYLEAARREGHALVVALNSDASVRGLKGPTRPITPQDQRARVVAGLEAVDYVVLFDDPTPLRVIEALRPDVLVKGADWAEDAIVGADLVRARGGRVVRVPLVPELSTTAVVDRILQRGGPASSKD